MAEPSRESVPRVVFRDLRMTCSACPSQWEGITTGGECFYARYRWGCLTWGFGASLNAAVDASIKGPALQLGDEYDGEMDTGTMLRYVGGAQSSEQSANKPASAATNQTRRSDGSD